MVLSHLLFLLICFSPIQGLLDAFEILTPTSEHRHCVHHLHANFKGRGFKGKAFKNELWAAARATNKTQFDRHMNEMKKLKEDAFTYLDKIDPATWSRHAFRTANKYDMLLNNLAESFNLWIKDARDKPLLTMLEMIRRKLMNRFEAKRDGAATATATICPKILKKLERHKDVARNYICHWKSVGQFAVDHYFEARRVVDMNEMTCSCGRWQLNGIPCAHVISAMYFDNKTPEDFVHR